MDYSDMLLYLCKLNSNFSNFIDLYLSLFPVKVYFCPFWHLKLPTALCSHSAVSTECSVRSRSLGSEAFKNVCCLLKYSVAEWAGTADYDE